MKLRASPLGTSASFGLAQAVLAVCVVVSAPFKPVLAEAFSCPDIHDLVEQSRTQFSLVRGETRSEFGGFSSTLELPGAQYCVIVGDAVKESYRCTWKYPYRDELAKTDFESFASAFTECLGDQVKKNDDQAVNHPDTYESYLFSLEGTEARITLKDKKALDSTFVSLTIEGMQVTTSSDN